MIVRWLNCAVARLGPIDALDLRPVFQPVVDLRDGTVRGYEALLRDGEDRGAQTLLAAARREDSLLALDLAARDAALRTSTEHGLGAPFTLFLNADPGTLDHYAPDLPPTRATLVVEVTERALIERPEAMLRALTRLRSAGFEMKCGLEVEFHLYRLAAEDGDRSLDPARAAWPRRGGFP